MNLITQMATKQRQQQQQQQHTNGLVHSQRHSANTISAGNTIKIYGNQRAQNKTCHRAVSSPMMQVAVRRLHHNHHRRHHHHHHQQRGIKIPAHLAANARGVALSQQRAAIRNNKLAIVGNLNKADLNDVHLVQKRGIDGLQETRTLTTATLQPTTTPVVRTNGITWCARRALPIARRRLKANNLPVSATDKEEEDKSNYDD